MYLYFKRLFPTTNLFNTITHQTRSFSRDPFPNKVIHYLHRAKLIDSIRLSLRSDSPDSLASLLNHRLVDSFVATNAIRAAPSPESALSLVETLQTNPQFSHTQATIHALATVLAKFKRNAELKILIGDVKAGRFGNVRVSFMNLINWYGVSEDFEAVLSTLDEYRCLDEKRLCTESYNIAMQTYARTGKNSESVKIFHEMIDEGANPNSRTYTIMIEHLLKYRNLDQAMEVFNLLPFMRIKRTLKQFSLMVEGFVDVGRFDEVKTLLNEMRDDGKFPNRGMLPYLLRMREAGFVEETNDYLSEMLPDERIKNVERYCLDGSDEDDNDEDDNVEEMEMESCKINEVKLKPWLDPKALASALQNWTPDVVSALEDAKFVWTSRLVCKLLRNFKKPETGWNFFCWVAFQPGFMHDGYTVQRMITLLARYGHVKLVDELISKVRRENIQLPFSTIKLIIEFYGISKIADAALKVFYDDRALCGRLSKFNLMLLYSTLLRTLTKCGRNSDALEVLDEMILNGVLPDNQTFAGLMHHFARNKDVKTMQKLFGMVKQSGLEPDAYMFKAMIQAYCKCERAALAWRVYEDMRDSNLLPDVATKDLLVKSLWSEGKRKEAAAVEESFVDNDHVLPLALPGHVWTVSSADLTKVYNIYSSCFTA